MSNAHHPIDEMAGAQGDTAIVGIFPARRNTVRANVLADLLEGTRVTSLDGVFESSTTRTSAVIEVMGKLYRWKIDRRDYSVGTNDGRLQQVTIYYLSRATIKAAFNAGAAVFIRDVREQRKARRKLAPKLRREAERRNIARQLARVDPRQGNLL